MTDKKKGEIKSQQHSSFQVTFRRFGIGLRRFYRDLSVGLRWTLIVLVSVAALAALVLSGSSLISSSSSKGLLPKDTILNEVSLRLRQVVSAISNVRDTVSMDSIFTEQIRSDAAQTVLFETVHKLDSLEDARFSDLLPEAISERYSSIRGRGVAYYDNAKHLTAWNSSRAGIANFDSVFSYAPSLEKHSKAIVVGSEQMFSWIVAIRKMISKDGTLLGYVTAKAVVGERFPLSTTEEHPLTIFEDIFTRSGREIRFSFSPFQMDSAISRSSYPIYLDTSDSSSAAGYLDITDIPVFRQTGLQRTLRFIRDSAFVLFIIILTWLGSWHLAELGCSERLLRSKLFFLGTIFAVLFFGRITLLLTDTLSSIVPQVLQDPQDFALPEGFGFFSNPLQLFTTIIFFTSFLALVWVVFVPQHTAWKADSKRIEEQDVFSTTGWLMKVMTIICVVLLLPAINFLFASIASILVENGSYHFLGNRFGFTKGSFILMEASFLLLGVAYFFSAMMVLVWALRLMIHLTASELSPTRSYIAHYIFFTLIATTAGWLFSPEILSIYPQVYWLIVCFALCLITVIIFSRDVAALRTGNKGDSLFYRTPRSGLAVLFLLTAAGFLLSPVVATQEYANDIDIVKQNLRQNTQVNDLTYSSLLDQAFISLTGDAAAIPPLETSSEVNNLAFNIWLKQFPESANRNIVIEVQDYNGKILSHFARNARLEDEKKLSHTRDSLSETLKSLHTRNVQVSYLVGSETHFETSYTPASIGVGFVTLDLPKERNAHLKDSLEKDRLIISISVWSDHFPQVTTPSLYDIVRTNGVSGDKLNWQNDEVYYADYQNSILQNSSTSTLELPAHISTLIDTALQKNEFIAREGKTEGSRSYTIFHKIGEEGVGTGRVMAATIIIPGINALLGLALSFNTVSLFIGFFVIFFALMVRSLFSKGKGGALKFRDRIFLIVLTIALVPLVIVTNITRSLLIEREQGIEREHLQRDAGVIADRLERSFSGSDSVSNGAVKASLNDLSRTLGRDISFYNDRGILSATNRPELYESSFLASQLSSETFRKVFSGQRSFTIEPLTSGSSSFDIGYRTVQKNPSGGIKGVIGVTSFRGAQIIEANIARTIELMYGAFAALGIILLLIGAWISVRVATPLQQLIAATERVTQGRLETIVNIKRKDEVGELAQAFNRMTSELERTRENVAQSEREGAWKEMARQVAHEIKNPLTPMKLSVQHVAHSYETGDSNFGSVFRRVIRTLSEQIDVLTRIATEFSRFGEMPRRKYGFVSLRKIAESAMALYDAERGRIRFVLDIERNLPPIYADQEEFRRALVNLIRNSLQAIDGWGIILIQAREKNGLIHLDFIDTGCGMSEETLMKAFDPNFSTKTSGMGLGLAIVKKIITDMSGTISVESKLGTGTTFHIELPAREYPAE